MAEEPLLRVSNLSKIYRRSHLGKVQTSVGVRGLSLDVLPGEIFGLLGLNGAGKTTTLKLILGLLFPTSGEIAISGRRLPDRSLANQVGFLPEVPYFPRHLTVMEVLHFYALLSGVPGNEIPWRMQDVLTAVNMVPHRDKRVRECSKGMLQRLSLAQALMHDPKFLILDEPTTGLDPLGLAELREMLLELNKKGKTILFSSHIISEVERLAHRVGILSGGSLVKVLCAGEWSGKEGGLEKIFVDTVKQGPAAL